MFDVEQTHGAPLPEAARRHKVIRAKTAVLVDAIRAARIADEYGDELGGAPGLSSGGRIQVLNGLSPAAEFSVLVHEYAHHLSH